jgi:chloramphenicol O-acetyltransferase type A
MIFEKIDINSWKRKEYFEHYFTNVPCTYSMTVKVDITPIKKKQMKLYPAMLYYLTTIVNRRSEFRTAINDSGELGVYSEMLPCYTVFHKDTETFSNIWTEYSSDFNTFSVAYENDMRKYGNKQGMIGKPNAPENTFPVSMIPWSTFEGFNLNLQKGYDYLIPIFTMGKYYQEDGRTILPLAIQVHHAVCDGFHICRFANELQELING